MKLTRKVVAAAVCASSFAIAAPVAPAGAAGSASINNVEFGAAQPATLNHDFGGGAWNDGSTTYQKNELQGDDWKCGEIPSFLLKFDTPTTPLATAPYTAKVVVNFSRDATGTSGAGLTPLITPEHLRVNAGAVRRSPNFPLVAVGQGPGETDSALSPNTPTARVATNPPPAVVNTGALFGGNASLAVLTFYVENIDANQRVIVRSDARIECKPGARPTGNMQVDVDSVVITSSDPDETISAGAQTVNFRGVGNLDVSANVKVEKWVSVGANCNDQKTSASTTAGTDVLYCYKVTNFGGSAASDVALTDDNATPGNLADDRVITLTGLTDEIGSNGLNDLAAGASATGTFSLTGGFGTDGTYVNVATAYTAYTTTPVPMGTAEATVIVATSSPDMTLSKSSTSTPTKAGDTVTYTLVVTNTGNVTLDGVKITDAKVTFTTCTNSVSGAVGQSGTESSTTSLAPGATWTCTATHTVTQAEVDAGKVENTATASTTTSGVTPKTADKSVTITGTKSMTLTKSSTSTPTKAGDTVTYTLVVTNTGDVTLDGVKITDAKVTFTTCTNSVSGAVGQSGTESSTTSLAPGATWTCTATHTVTQAEVDAGKVENTATASTTTSGVTPKTADKSVTITGTKSMTLTKSSTSTPTKAGDTVTYTLVVTNTGDVTLDGVKITDAKVTFTTCTNSVSGAVGQSGTESSTTSLAPGATWTCTATHTVTQAEVDAGKVENTATASTTTSGVTPKTADKSVTITGTKSMTLTKSSTSTPTKAGDTVTYTLVVTNTGDVTLDGVKITDAKVTFTTCTNSVSGAVGQSGTESSTTSLAPGATWTCTATHTVTQAEVDAGKVENTATASTTTSGVTPKTADKSVTITGTKSMTLTKSSTSTPTKAGDTVTYTLVVTNTGDVTLDGVKITDAKVTFTTCTNSVSGAVGQSGTESSTTSLAPGATWTCTATHTVTQAEVDAGKVENTATASTTTSGVTPKTADKSVTITGTKSMTLTKSSTSTPTKAGDTVTYTLVVTNTGDVTLDGVKITDAKVTFTTCTNSVSGAVGQSGTESSTTSLAPGATWTCTATHTVTQAEVDAGKVENTATASTTTSGVTPKTADKSVTITGTKSMTLTKSSTSTPTKAGDTVTYTLVVTNTGDVTLDGVKITDAKVTFTTCTNSVSGAVGQSGTESSTTSLAPGATWTCTATHTVTQAEVDAGKVENTATATSSTTGAAQQTAMKNLSIIPNPSLEVTLEEKNTKKLAVGDKVPYEVVVTNNGNTTLTNVSPIVTNIVITGCTPTVPTTLKVGESITCRAYHIVTENDVIRGVIRAQAIARGVSPTNSNASVPAEAPDVLTPLSLPATGSDSNSTTRFALALLALGTVLVLLRRRRLS